LKTKFRDGRLIFFHLKTTQKKYIIKHKKWVSPIHMNWTKKHHHRRHIVKKSKRASIKVDEISTQKAIISTQKRNLPHISELSTSQSEICSKSCICDKVSKDNCVCEKKEITSECLSIDTSTTLTNDFQYTIIINTTTNKLTVTLGTPKKTDHSCEKSGVVSKTIYLSEASVGTIQISINSSETHDLDTTSNKAIQLAYIPCLKKWIVISNNSIETGIETGIENSWIQEQKISGISPDRFVGWDVSLSGDGNTLALGNGLDETLIYVRNGTGTTSTWTFQQKLVGTGVIGAANQGYSVALSYDGNLLAVGGLSDNSGQGAVWIFSRSLGVWTQTDKLVGTGNIGPTAQGCSVALSYDGVIFYLAVGGPGDNGGVGAVWIWNLVGGVWTQKDKLVGTGNIGFSHQGKSVSISDNAFNLAVGGPGDNNNGATWIFSRDFSTNTWT
jgi:hypothetical protein